MMRRLIAVLLAGVLAVVAGVAAASAVSPTPEPAEPHERVAQAKLGSARSEARSADPAGGPLWAVRTYEGLTGQSCLTLSRTDGKAFGPIVDGRIRDLPVDGSGSCGDLDGDRVQLLLATFAPTPKPRSVIFGRVQDAASAVEVVVAGRATDVDVAADGSFLLVVAADLKPEQISARVLDPSGATIERGL